MAESNDGCGRVMKADVAVPQQQVPAIPPNPQAKVLPKQDKPKS